MDPRVLALGPTFAALNRRVARGALARGDFRLGLRLMLMGLEFYRAWEFPVALLDLAPRPGQRLLDAGSAKSVFPLYLALRGVEVHAVDLDERIRWQEAYARAVGRADLVGEKLFVRVGDATSNPEPDASFDLVAGISSVEHFDGDGDIRFVREARRLLKPGGKLLLSFGVREAHEEGRWGNFFNRRYDELTLRERIVGPSGMELEKVRYFEGPLAKPFVRWWFRLPVPVRNGLLGFLQQPAFRLIYPRDRPDRLNAWYLSLVLRK